MFIARHCRWMMVLCLFPHLFGEEFPVGRLVERVDCEAHPGQSYALYLPSNYSPARQWPALYAFDPVARGALPVSIFAPAAERFGYIVVGSHNSRNGPVEWGYDAAVAMFEDTFGRFSINSERVYLTGFSGGSRLISRLGSVARNIAGMIACGAALHNDVQPTDLRFSYVGIVGNGDMNYRELHELRDQLKQNAQVPNRLFVFDGGHQWPSAEDAEKALRWLEIDSVRRGISSRDIGFVEGFFNEDLAEARTIERSGGILQILQAYQDLETDYDGLLDLTLVHEKLTRLSDQPKLKEALRRRKEVRREELSQIQKHYRYLGEVPGEKYKTLGWWQKRVNWLSEKREHEGDEEGRLMWTRLHDLLWRSALERSWLAEDSRVAVRLARIAAVAQPESAYVLYGLARALATAGRAEESIEVLSRAIDRGMNAAGALRRESAFDSMRDSEPFKELLARLPQR